MNQYGAPYHTLSGKCEPPCPLPFPLRTFPGNCYNRTKPITARKLGDDFDRAAVLETLTQNAQNAAGAAEKPLPQQGHLRSLKDRLERAKATVNALKQDAAQREAVQTDYPQYRADRKRCIEYGGYFLPKSNRGKSGPNVPDA